MSNIFPKQMLENGIPQTDLTERDLQKIKEFEDKGLPGLYNVKETTLARIMDMYLSGKPYSQIANITRVEKVIIQYFSKKFDWFRVRNDYLIELESNIRNRVVASRVISQDFLLQLKQVWEKKMSKHLNQFLLTDDENHVENIDLRELDRYLKVTSMLHEIDLQNNVTKQIAPTVGLNLGEGVTIQKLDNNRVEITPKQKTIGEQLKMFVEMKRNKENEENNKKSDINKEEQSDSEDA